MTRGRKIGGKIFCQALSVSARSSTYTHIIARSIVIVSLLGCGMIFITWFIVVLEAQSWWFVLSLEVESRCLLCVKRDRLTVAVSRLQQNLTGFLVLPGVKARTGLLLMVSLFFLELLNAHEKSLLPSLWYWSCWLFCPHSHCLNCHCHGFFRVGHYNQ